MDIIKTLVAEDIEPVLKRYCSILETDPQIVVVGEAKNGYEAVMQTALKRPDVILMDIEMEDKEAGIRASREILRQFPDIKIIILTVYEEDELVFSAFQNGVVDYILKNAHPNDIITGVKDAYYNRSPIRPLIAEKIRREFQRIKTGEDSFLYNLHILSQLTHTEVDILDLLEKGNTRREICEIRHVELSTIKSQIHSILKKMEKETIQEVIENLRSTQFFDTLRSIKENRNSRKIP